ncbi:DUF4231 domain-containing protein [Streptomyces jumonjinensis]|uniref:DUF4231 domain-containing protein n=1 Tax=Streptomyces jumonjinensis TaxID=1945 RepID=A0A646KA47_STRJU|nr:DUF4231 domain-containing protein [Streptomyces jumonjinensis]MQS98969.1 DUF4231 domain-containing protein [Streptomyces jumonjinensis]
MTGIAEPSGSIVFRNSDLPDLFHHTDTIAIARQRESVTATRGQLLLLVAGAAAAVLPASLEWGGAVQPAGALSALSYAGVLLLGYRASKRGAKSQWQLNRSAAEFIKSMCWRYSVHATPFDTRSVDADRLFTTRLEEGLRELRKVGWEDPRPALPALASRELVTPAMRRLYAEPFSIRKETYIRDRLIEQRNWYHRSADNSRRATRLWSSSIGLLTLLALFFSLLRAFSLTGSLDVAGLLSAAAAGALAWSEIRRHQPLIAAHSLVEEDLAAMHKAMETSVTETQWPSAVYETERIVSPQHTDWLARHRS